MLLVCNNGNVSSSESQLEGKTPDEIEMMRVMGFSGFNTTKVCVSLC